MAIIYALRKESQIVILDLYLDLLTLFQSKTMQFALYLIKHFLKLFLLVFYIHILFFRDPEVLAVTKKLWFGGVNDVISDEDIK